MARIIERKMSLIITALVLIALAAIAAIIGAVIIVYVFGYGREAEGD